VASGEVFPLTASCSRFTLTGTSRSASPLRLHPLDHASRWGLEHVGDQVASFRLEFGERAWSRGVPMRMPW